MLREANGLSQEQAAARTGISARALKSHDGLRVIGRSGGRSHTRRGRQAAGGDDRARRAPPAEGPQLARLLFLRQKTKSPSNLASSSIKSSPTCAKFAARQAELRGGATQLCIATPRHLRIAVERSPSDDPGAERAVPRRDAAMLSRNRGQTTGTSDATRRTMDTRVGNALVATDITRYVHDAAARAARLPGCAITLAHTVPAAQPAPVEASLYAAARPLVRSDQ